MTLDLKRPLVIFDVETTGIHPQVDRVCQIGLVKLYPTGKVTEWRSLINPTIPIPPEVSAIHGITDEAVKDAPVFKDVAPQLAGGLMGCDVGGFNVRFDVTFIDKEFERVGGKDVLKGCLVVDSFRIFLQKEPRNLEAAVKFYLNREITGAHDALADARSAYQVLVAQLERYPDLPRDVDELHKIYFESPAQGHLDADGKLAWRHNEATINFGKWAAIPIRKVDRGYLEWMLKGDFSEVVKNVIRECIAGRYPRRD